MRQLQVTVPEKFSDEAKEIVEEFSSDVSSKKVEKKDKDAVEFSVTVDEDKVDDVTEELKSIDDLENGELTIRVLDQESLIEKGQETRGGSTDLSQQEIYSQAQEFSGFSQAQWGLAVLSGAVASMGISMNNTIVVIGAMMFAPLLSPLVAASISITAGDRTLLEESLNTTVLSALVVVAASTVPALFMGEGELLTVFTSFSSTNIVLACLVGCAASLTAATDRSDQVAGVAVAIALVPPLAATGIAAASMNIQSAFSAGLIAFANMLGILVTGSLTFRLLGVSPETYYKEVQARRLRLLVPAAAFILLALMMAEIIL